MLRNHLDALIRAAGLDPADVTAVRAFPGKPNKLDIITRTAVHEYRLDEPKSEPDLPPVEPANDEDTEG